MIKQTMAKPTESHSTMPRFFDESVTVNISPASSLSTGKSVLITMHVFVKTLLYGAQQGLVGWLRLQV